MVRLEDIRDSGYLFFRFEIFNLMERQSGGAQQEVQSIGPETLLITPTDDVVEAVVGKFKLEVPELLRDQAHMEEPQETTLTINDYGRVIHPLGTLLTLMVPFTGDASMFWVRPSTFNSAPPRAHLHNNNVVVQISGVKLKPEHVNKSFSDVLDNIEQYLHWQRENVTKFNNDLRGQIRRAVENRKEKLLADRNLVAGLNFPMRARADAPKTYVALQVRKKIVPVLKPATAPFKPEPTLGEDLYKHVLSVVENMTLVMERSPTAFAEMGEEDIRQHYLVQLNGQFEGAATGETFNHQGKTDILIRAEGRNIFIAECKFWRGEKSFAETIDQILSYLSWRDTKAAIILFNRNKNFTEVLSKVRAVADAHPHKKKGPLVESETRFRYVFGNPQDHNREVILTIVVFNVPSAGVDHG